MTNLTDNLDARVGNSFTAAQKTAAITTALLELGISDGDSVYDDKNAVNLAQAILINQRVIEASLSDTSQISNIKTMSEMIESIQIKTSKSMKSNFYNIINYKQPDDALDPYDG